MRVRGGMRWSPMLVAIMVVSLLAPATAGGATTPPPVTVARFSIQVDGAEIATFDQLDGMSSEVDVTDYMDTTDKGLIVKGLPGKHKPPTVVLKRGQTRSLTLWTWYNAARAGSATGQRACSLVMFDADGRPLARYQLENAWPSRIESVAVKSGTTQVLYESVWLVARSITRLNP